MMMRPAAQRPKARPCAPQKQTWTATYEGHPTTALQYAIASAREDVRCARGKYLPMAQRRLEWLEAELEAMQPK